MIEVNWLAIVVCAVVGMGIGALWHSKMLFGNAYMRAAGMDMNMSPEKMAAIQKEMWKYYLTQFVLLSITLFMLSHSIVMGTAYFGYSGVTAGLSTAFWNWFGYVMPVTAGAALWSSRPRKEAWNLFFISAGYQLVCFLIFGAILGAWM